MGLIARKMLLGLQPLSPAMLIQTSLASSLYSNVIYIGLPLKMIQKLQLVQIAAACFC